MNEALPVSLGTESISILPNTLVEDEKHDYDPSEINQNPRAPRQPMLNKPRRSHEKLMIPSAPRTNSIYSKNLSASTSKSTSSSLTARSSVSLKDPLRVSTKSERPGDYRGLGIPTNSIITQVTPEIVKPPQKKPTTRKNDFMSVIRKYVCCMDPSMFDSTSQLELNPPTSLGFAPASPGKNLLLPPILPVDVGKKCLVLDLDETLVHSSFKPVEPCDFTVPVEIENTMHNVYVLKRPFVDEFMNNLADHFEVVVFTASLAKYANPVIDLLDRQKVVRHRLFREACVHIKGTYVKDLSMLGRPLKDVIIIDNSPASYMFHPRNAVPISSWFSDNNDSELMDLIPLLKDLSTVDDVTAVLDTGKLK